MADGQATAPKPGFFKGTVKMAAGGLLGLCTGAVAMYSQAIVDKVVKPTKPVANFAVAGTDGLTATFNNLASGDSGWWDFGDGTPLEAFDAAKPSVTHAFPAPGKYSVKLSVRNFLMEENDRDVAVSITSAPNTLPPSVTSLRVDAIKEQAPATYRITGELKNADEVVWRLGDKAEHTDAPAGPFEKYVTFDKPGQYPIVLTALSKSKKDPSVEVRTVSVTAAAKAGYDVLVTVTDVGTRTRPTTRPMMVVCPVSEKGKPTAGFDRTVNAAPGAVITSATFDAKKMPASVKNPKAEVAADKKSVRVTGAWADANKAGGSDVMIPLILSEDHTAAVAPLKNVLGATMGDTGLMTVKLPPAVLAGGQRTIDVDIGYHTQTGQRQQVAKGTLDAAGNWSAPVAGQPFVVQAKAAGGAVEVRFANAPTAGAKK